MQPKRPNPADPAAMAALLAYCRRTGKKLLAPGPYAAGSRGGAMALFGALRAKACLASNPSETLHLVGLACAGGLWRWRWLDGLASTRAAARRARALRAARAAGPQPFEVGAF